MRIRGESCAKSKISSKISQAIKCKAGVLTRGRLLIHPRTVLRGDELEAELGGFLLHVFDLLLFILRFVFFDIDGLVFHFVLQHAMLRQAQHKYTTRAIMCAVATVAWALSSLPRSLR